jgi:hypothetical protein
MFICYFRFIPGTISTGMDFRSTSEGNCTNHEGLPTLEQLGNNWHRTLMVMNNRTLIGRREDTIVWKDKENTDSRHYTMWLPLDYNPQNPLSTTTEATQPASPSAKSILNPQTPSQGGVVVPLAPRPFSDWLTTTTQTGKYNESWSCNRQGFIYLSLCPM